MKKALIFIGIAVTAVVGCSKNGSTPSSQASITGKWKVAKFVDWWWNGGSQLRDTIAGDPGEYIDFRSNGTVYCYDWYEGGIAREYKYDTLSYEINGTTIVIQNKSGWADTANIQKLTDTSVTLYFTGLSGYPKDQLWDYLSR
jgi:hypothetical protein